MEAQHVVSNQAKHLTRQNGLASSGTRSPRSMKSLARWPAGVPAATSARSRSPAEMCASPKRCTISSHCARGRTQALLWALRCVRGGACLRALATGGRAGNDHLQRAARLTLAASAVADAHAPGGPLARGGCAWRCGHGERAMRAGCCARSTHSTTAPTGQRHGGCAQRRHGECRGGKSSEARRGHRSVGRK